MAGTAPAAHGGTGITVHPRALGGYADAAAELGTELRRFSAHDLRTARELPPDAFGPVGRDTGFTAALTRFADRATAGSGVLSRQVSAVAGTVRQSADAYRATERAATERLREIATTAPAATPA